MVALKLYPVGIQTFEEIIRRDFLYVDKTEYIYRMTHGSGKYFFLSRPRRFGKSLLTSTFKSYFEGEKALFKGLAIEKLEKDWTEYPVIHLSMAGGKHMEKDELEILSFAFIAAMMSLLTFSKISIVIRQLFVFDNCLMLRKYSAVRL